MVELEPDYGQNQKIIHQNSLLILAAGHFLKKLWIEDMSFHPDTSFKSNDIIELWQNRINRLLKVNE